MNLSYFGSTIDQAQAGAVLRLSADDKNVSPYELVAYAQQQGYVSQRLVNGSTDLARTLLSNGIPVLVETWHEDGPDDGMGHYRLLVGYDDAAQTWTVYDCVRSHQPDLCRALRRPALLRLARWTTYGRCLTARLCSPTRLTVRR